MRRALPLLAVLIAGALATAARAQPAEAVPPGSTPWVPFEFVNDRQIFLPVKINGQATMALLDSGAGRSFIDVGVARALGLPLKAQRPITGPNGVQNGADVDHVEVVIGNLNEHDFPLTALDLRALSQESRHAIPYVIGDDMFNDIAVDIDFAHHRLRFRQPGPEIKPAGAVEIPLTREQGRILAPISIEGRAPILAEIDLGDSGAVTLSPAYAKTLLAGRPSTKETHIGLGGARQSTLTTLKSVAFAGRTMADVPAQVPETWLDGASPLTQARLGAQMLKGYHIVFDLPEKRLYVAVDEPPTALVFPKDRLGIEGASAAGGGFQINYVRPGSPAAAAGLKAGDVIKGIDADGPTDLKKGQIAFNDIATGPAGRKLILTLTSGEVKRLALADYY
jgi:hypothetical protein